jgi:hypothetical protein
VWLNERIVHSNDIDLVVLDGIAEDDSPNATEAIDSDLCWCHICVLLKIRPRDDNENQARALDVEKGLVKLNELRVADELTCLDDCFSLCSRG